MSNDNLSDVSDESFNADVIERSFHQPVLADFWAPWCGPCRMLGPVLEGLAQEMVGAFHLSKINTESAPRVASEYRISGIPAVKLFIGGKVAAEFTGALPESQVRTFLAEHLPNEASQALGEGRRLLAQGKPAEAIAAFETALQLDSNQHEARIELALLRLEDGDTESVLALLAPIGAHDAHREKADAIAQLVGFATACADAGGLETILKQADTGSDTAETSLVRGQCVAVTGRYEEALEALLHSVSVDRKFADEAARKAMLAIFQIIGIRSDVANAFRRRLSIYL